MKTPERFQHHRNFTQADMGIHFMQLCRTSKKAASPELMAWLNELSRQQSRFTRVIHANASKLLTWTGAYLILVTLVLPMVYCTIWPTMPKWVSSPIIISAFLPVEIAVIIALLNLGWMVHHASGKSSELTYNYMRTRMHEFCFDSKDDLIKGYHIAYRNIKALGYKIGISFGTVCLLIKCRDEPIAAPFRFLTDTLLSMPDSLIVKSLGILASFLLFAYVFLVFKPLYHLKRLGKVMDEHTAK
ncbi:MAG: hypothetical protein LBV12_11140 [Puniceicoccales bacterium]|jgi:hypothetical protein|nr:hypothetical protein [Puniceicoccales bacterium]